MNIYSVVTTRFSNEVVNASVNLGSQNYPLPSVEELVRISELCEYKLRLILLFDGSKCVGLAMCFLEDRRVSGFDMKIYSILGYKLFDYNRIYFKKGYANYLLKEISYDARKCNVDAVILDNLINDFQGEGLTNTNLKISKVQVLKKEKYSYDFNYIINKKKLRKHYERIKRKYKYECIHLQGDFTEKDLGELSQLHKERWAFDYINSGFNDPTRIPLYQVNRKNKLLTKIYIDDELFAIHYGMIYRRILLFHTPAINIKYMSHSPLQILIYEMAKYCDTNTLEIFDFGLGDEDYKSRYCNSTRELAHIFLPVSSKGYIAKLVGSVASKRKNDLYKIEKIGKTLKHKIISRFTKIRYFKYEGDVIKEKTDKLSNRFCVFSDYFTYVDFCRSVGFTILKVHYDRFRLGNIFFCLVGSRKILSYGWGTDASSFYISEINKNVSVSEDMLLYDFVTEEIKRGKGYYTSLLRHIINEYKEKELLIYAVRDNYASIKGILNAGFVKITDIKNKQQFDKRVDLNAKE